MKEIISILSIAFTVFLWAAESDFTFKPELSGWQKSRNAVFDPAEKISGDGSLKLTGNSSVSKKIQLEPGAEYEVSVFIKAKDVTGGQYKGVLLRLTDGKKFYAVPAIRKIFLDKALSTGRNACGRSKARLSAKAPLP